MKQAGRNSSGTRSCCLSKRQTAVSHSGSPHAVQLLLCPEFSRGQQMLRCLSGGCSSQVQHWPAHLYASRGLSVPALLPDTLYSPKSAEQREDRSLFPQSVFNLPVPALFSSTAGVISYPVISGLTKELCSPPISPLPWSKGMFGLSHSAHPQAPSWKVSSNSGPPPFQRAHPS